MNDFSDYYAFIEGKSHLGFSLAEVAQLNLHKLARRYPDGFSREASIKREAPA